MLQGFAVLLAANHTGVMLLLRHCLKWPADPDSQVPGAPHLSTMRQELQHCRHHAPCERHSARNPDASPQPSCDVHGQDDDAVG